MMKVKNTLPLLAGLLAMAGLWWGCAGGGGVSAWREVFPSGRATYQISLDGGQGDDTRLYAVNDADDEVEDEDNEVDADDEIEDEEDEVEDEEDEVDDEADADEAEDDELITDQANSGEEADKDSENEDVDEEDETVPEVLHPQLEKLLDMLIDDDKVLILKEK